MDISAKILELLNEFESTNLCPICSRKCEKPVKIKMCGHYFCELCLEKSRKSNCPKCNMFYECKDIERNNIARTSQKHFAKLHMLLGNIQPGELSNQLLNDLENSEETQQSLELNSNEASNTFLYDNNKYHVNFITILSTKKNSKGETPLHLACKKGKLEDVKKLIAQKVDINAKDYAGWAPLHEAIQSQSLEVVKYLLENGCLLDIPGPDYITPLHQAVLLDNIELVKLLLKCGANKDMVDYSGHKAIDSTENENIIQLLQTFKITPNEQYVFEVYLPSDIYLYCHTVEESYKNKLLSCQNINVVDKMDIKKKLTHFVIQKTHKISFKILQAMLEGLQFLIQDSVEDYISGKYFIDIPNHVFLIDNDQLNKGIRKSMISAILKFPKLFNGINFFIEDHSSPVDVYNLKVDKEYLTRLIEAGGGHMLHRAPALRTCEKKYLHPFFASEHSYTYRCWNFIIYVENNAPELLYNMQEIQHKSSRWLIDCILKYEIND